MFPTNIIFGAIIKIISNVITSYFENSKHRDELLGMRDEKVLQAQLEIARNNNKDWLGKLSRTIIFLLLTGTYCYICINCLEMLGTEIVVPVEIRPGFLSRFVNKPVETTMIISPGVILQQFFEVIQVILGAFCVPSKRR